MELIYLKRMEVVASECVKKDKGNTLTKNLLTILFYH